VPKNAAGRPGDFAQALMDLGATICTPKKPACALCPWQAACVARKAGIVADLPRRRPKGEKPLRRGVAFWAVRQDGAVLLRRRPENGLLGGMIEVPSTEWRAATWSDAAARRAEPVAADWRALPGVVRHGFTHFDLELSVMAAAVGAATADGIWSAPERLGEHALPTLMKKVVAHAMKATLGPHR
jgi:A/G-specific adenine glycosylase